MKWLALFGIVLIVGCKTTQKNEAGTYDTNLWVNSYRVDCAAESCLQISTAEAYPAAADDWTTYIGDIDRLTYEAGHIYRLRVRVDTSDVAAYRYRLLETLDKQRDERLALNDLWALQKLNGEELAQPYQRGQPYIELHLRDQRLAGRMMCNEIMGKLSLGKEQEIRFSRVSSTRIACIKHRKGEADFLNAIGETVKWQRKDNRLLFLDQAGTVRMEFIKMD